LVDVSKNEVNVVLPSSPSQIVMVVEEKGRGEGGGGREVGGRRK
jgi:hypothetical protein